MMSKGFDKNHPYYAGDVASEVTPDEAWVMAEYYAGDVASEIIPSPAASAIAEASHELELQSKQVEALSVLANSVKSIANFIESGELAKLVGNMGRVSIMQSIFGGLAAKDGRNALDARTIKQNSLEVVEIIESVFNKMQERMNERNRDPEIKSAEE